MPPGVGDGYLARMRAYLGEMFPWGPMGLAAVAAYVGLAGFARLVHGVALPLLARHTVVGAFACFDLLLILRLMDELKDEAIDRALFPARPLPSGRVRRADIQVSLGIAVAAYLAVNALGGLAFVGALVLLGYAWLMYRRFFVPDLLLRSLPLTLATHNPIIPLMVLHGFAVALRAAEVPPDRIQWWPVLAFTGIVAAAFLGWELARKIRAPADEDAYVTYSRLLGPAGAVATTAAVQGIGVALGLWLWQRYALSWTYPALLAGSWALNGYAFVRYVRAPTTRTARLKPFAQGNLFVVLAAQVLEFAVWR